jgi:hypothetical protein
MKRTKTELRKAATVAKTRLKNGFWGQENCSVRVKCGTDDDDFYGQVAACLRAGIANPLVHVLNHEHIATLDEAARQRYVLHTSERVNECINLFNRVESRRVC